MDAKQPMHKTLKEALPGAALAFVLGFLMIWSAPHPEVRGPFPVTAPDDIYKPAWSRADCGETCTVKFSPGGSIDHYNEQADHVKADGITLKIDGRCISACTMAAAKARPNTCITRNATMEFHRGIAVDRTTEKPLYRVDVEQYYPADINGWVRRHGGFPGKDISKAEMGRFLVMPFSAAKRYFKVCE